MLRQRHVSEKNNNKKKKRRKNSAKKEPCGKGRVKRAMKGEAQNNTENEKEEEQ